MITNDDPTLDSLDKIVQDIDRLAAKMQRLFPQTMQNVLRDVKGIDGVIKLMEKGEGK